MRLNRNAPARAALPSWRGRMREGRPHATCDQCGNDYDKAFQLTKEGRTWTFDSFECAIQAVAPVCPHCGVRIVGHGVEEGGRVFCCAHCAKHQGATAVKDRA
jgi:phage terminase large subunit GpA-like protein